METVSKEIIISGDSLIMDIQKAFNLYYPFLKIEFSHGEKRLLSVKNLNVNPSNFISQLAKIKTTAKVNIDNNRTVAEIEKDLKTS